MARQMLYLHWKTVRWGLLLFVVAGFALPVLSVQGLGGGDHLPSWAFAAQVLDMGALWTPLFPVLAVATGSVLALSAWMWDHHGKHVYALSLPVDRWRYAVLKFAAGGLLVLVPTAAFGLGAWLAGASVAVPAGLQAYPGALTLRFLAATLTAYGIFFALASGTMRTTVILLSTLFVVLTFGNGLMAFSAQWIPALEGVRIDTLLAHAAGADFSPLRIFAGNWFLIDV